MDEEIAKAVKALRAAEQTLRERVTYGALCAVIEAERKLDKLLKEAKP